MPGGDRTGPQGLGPRSGGRRGRCSGHDGPGSNSGNGRGGGFGRFRGNFCQPFIGVVGETIPDEATKLKRKIADTEETLAVMKERFGSLPKDDR